MTAGVGSRGRTEVRVREDKNLRGAWSGQPRPRGSQANRVGRSGHSARGKQSLKHPRASSLKKGSQDFLRGTLGWWLSLVTGDRGSQVVTGLWAWGQGNTVSQPLPGDFGVSLSWAARWDTPGPGCGHRNLRPPRFDLTHRREGDAAAAERGRERVLWRVWERWEEGGAPPASLTQCPHLYPLPNPGPQIS